MPDRESREAAVIFVDRNGVPKPEILPNARFKATVQQYLELPRDVRIQKHPPVFRSDWLGESVLNALKLLFKGKCAYCEQAIVDAEYKNIDFFRPTSGATSGGKPVDVGHYVWLATSWPNLYLACIPCRERKGDRFPILEDSRYPVERVIPLHKKREPDLVAAMNREETPLLLDPCQGDPSSHFRFEGGMARPASNDPRASATIELLGLNRADLVRGRLSALDSLRDGFIKLRDSPEKEETSLRKALEGVYNQTLRDGRPFVGYLRQMLPQLLPADVADHMGRKEFERAAECWKKPGGGVLALRSDGKGSPANPPVLSRSSPVTERRAVSPGGRPDCVPVSLRKIKIENFLLIGNLEIELFPGASSPEKTPCLALVGENASGKSTLLKAIGLALAGGGSCGSLVKEGADHGAITLWTHSGSYGEERFSLSFYRDPNVTAKWHAEGRGRETPLWPVLAYGPYRYFEAEGNGGHSFGRLDSLFKPIPIHSPLPWLNRLESDELQPVAAIVRGTIPFPDEERQYLVNVGGEVRLKTVHERGGNGDRFSDLSSGYLSILSIVLDVARSFKEYGVNPREGAGVVLVDEMENHLHPHWRMNIVRQLRALFPRIQFIVTTHDPLILRGFEKGEILLMARNEDGGLKTVRDLPDVQAWQVDQVLTSPVYSLHGTLGDELEEKFRRYYGLLSLDESRLGLEQKEELVQLKLELGEKGQFGGHRREQLMLEAIDQFLARNPNSYKLDDETLGLLKDIWDEN